MVENVRHDRAGNKPVGVCQVGVKERDAHSRRHIVRIHVVLGLNDRHPLRTIRSTCQYALVTACSLYASLSPTWPRGARSSVHLSPNGRRLLALLLHGFQRLPARCAVALTRTAHARPHAPRPPAPPASVLDTQLSVLDTQLSVLDTQLSVLDTQLSVLDTDGHHLGVDAAGCADGSVVVWDYLALFVVWDYLALFVV